MRHISENFQGQFSTRSTKDYKHKLWKLPLTRVHNSAKIIRLSIASLSLGNHHPAGKMNGKS
jgi:hypothetical protein